MRPMTRLSCHLPRPAACVAVAVLMACSVNTDSSARTQGPALIDRLPADATAIAWIDFEALAASLPPDMWTQYQDMIGGGGTAESERFFAATGLDPRTDLKQVGFATVPGAGDEEQWLALVAADFDSSKLLELLFDAETVEYEGVTLYPTQDVVRRLSEAPANERQGAPANPGEVDALAAVWLAILDDRTLALGTEAALRTVVDVDAGRHDALKSDVAMNDRISDVAQRGQIWLVATHDAWSRRVYQSALAPMLPPEIIQRVDVMTMSMRLDDGLALRLTGITDSEATAQDLATTLNGMLAIGRMGMQQREPELFDFIDRGVSVGREGSDFHLDITLTAADLEILRQRAEEMQRNIGGGS